MPKLILVAGSVVVIAALAVFGITCYLAIDDLAGCSLPEPASPKCAPADAIVVVSGGDTTARTTEAVALFKAGWGARMLLSGAALDTSGPSNAETMRRQVLAAGVPEADVVLDTLSLNTRDNALSAAKILPDAGRVIVVTSPYHQRRVDIEFNRAFRQNVTIVNHPTPYDRAWNTSWWLTPLGWWLAISEVIKTTAVLLWR